MVILEEHIALKDINFFCKQFAAMVQAGISISMALEICGQQCIHKNLKKHIQSMQEAVLNGNGLSEAAAKEKIFPPLLIHMIACGEAAGNLEQVLSQTVGHFENQLEIKQRVKKALLYPSVVFLTLICAVVILMIKVVPSFETLLEETGAQIPGATKMLIGLSDFVINNWLLLLIVSILAIGSSMLMPKTKVGKALLDQVALSVPVFGNLNKKSMAASFSATLSMLISSGVPMLQAMQMTKEVMNNVVVCQELEEAVHDLKQGSSLYEALRKSRIYPPILQSMIHIGEETGALDEMLIKMSRYFKEEVQLVVEQLMVLIEPMLTIVMAFLVGGFMLAVVQPTFSAATAVM